MNIHTYYTNLIKNLTKASFVGWVSEKDRKYLQINIDGRKFSMAFEGKDEATQEDYRLLIQQLLDNGGDTKTTESL